MPSRRSPDEEPAHDVLAAEAFAMPAADPRLHREPAHDVLAAEAFAMPGADPRLHKEPAHDVLAAEAFAMPGADPALHHGRVVLPDDPTGIAEAHDVLAAEEFAMPAGSPIGADGLFAPHHGPSRRLAWTAAAAVTGYVLLRHRRRLRHRRSATSDSPARADGWRLRWRAARRPFSAIAWRRLCRSCARSRPDPSTSP